MQSKPDKVHPAIRALEAEVLDVHWRTLPFFTASTTKCAVLLLTAFTLRWHSLAAEKDEPRVFRHDDLRRLLGGLRWCMQWAYAQSRDVDESFDPSIADVNEALLFGADYEDIADHMKAASIGTESVELLPNGTSVQFDFNDGSTGLQLLNAFTAGDEVDAAYEQVVRAAVTGADGTRWVDALNEGLQVLWTQTYEAAFQGIHSHTIGLPFVQYEPMRLPGDWDVGGYTLHQGADAWAHVRGFSQICLMTCTKVPDTCIIIVPMSLMLATIKPYFDGEKAAALWLADMTFDPNEKSPNVLVHPLIALGEHVATSPALVASLRCERNLTKAIVRRPARSKAWEPIKDRKEGVFRDELARLLTPLGWSVEGPVAVTDGEREDGNIDAVLTDPTGHVVLAELKWPIAADDIREVFDDETEFQTGRDQIANALAWARTHWSRVEQVCPRVPSETDRKGVTAWVLSRSTVPDFLEDKAVAVVPTFTFDMLATALTNGATSADMVRGAVQERIRTLPLHHVGTGHVGITVGRTEWLLPVAALQPK